MMEMTGPALETRKRRFASDCVVGPGGLEPPTQTVISDGTRIAGVAPEFLGLRELSVNINL